MGHHAATRRPTHTVEPTDKEVQDGHQGDCQALVVSTNPLHRNDHEHHRDGSEDQTQRQEALCIAAIGDTGHDKLGEAIGDGVHGEHHTQLALLEAERREHRDCHGEVLADNIESRVTNKDTDEDLPTQATVSLICLGACLLRLKSRRSQKIPHNKFYLNISYSESQRIVVFLQKQLLRKQKG